MVHTHPPHHTLEGGSEHSSPYLPAHYHGHEPLHGQYTPSSHHNLYPRPHGKNQFCPIGPTCALICLLLLILVGGFAVLAAALIMLKNDPNSSTGTTCFIVAISILAIPFVWALPFVWGTMPGAFTEPMPFTSPLWCGLRRCLELLG